MKVPNEIKMESDLTQPTSPGSSQLTPDEVDELMFKQYCTHDCAEALSRLESKADKIDDTMSDTNTRMKAVERNVKALLEPKKQLVEERDHLQKENAFLKKQYRQLARKMKSGVTSPLRDISNNRVKASQGNQLSAKVKKADDHVQRNSSKNVEAAKKKIIKNTQSGHGIYTTK